MTTTVSPRSSVTDDTDDDDDDTDDDDDDDDSSSSSQALTTTTTSERLTRPPVDARARSTGTCRFPAPDRDGVVAVAVARAVKKPASIVRSTGDV
jgi:hypothetical protein